MKNNKKRLVNGLIVLLITACAKPIAPEPQLAAPPVLLDQPRNIILMIGDGMGLSTISAALYDSNKPMNLERFPVVGLHKSYSFDDLITDSAAGATAFSCGLKTYNNAIGVNADTIPCKTILEDAEQKELATGMVVTCSVVHATPACFIAHQPMRVMYEEIAADFLNTDIDLLIGGGKRYFDEREGDKRNLISELKQKGYQVWDYTATALSNLKLNADKKIVYFTADNHPPGALQGRNYLPQAVEKALEHLSQRSEKGFFLMVEGSQIDWAGHNNQEQELIAETLDFDKAVGVALDFAQKRGDTLVLVTADHECGGVSIGPNSKMGQIKPLFNTNGHNGAMVPVFAFGPQAGLFNGIYENTAIYDKMRMALGFDKN